MTDGGWREKRRRDMVAEESGDGKRSRGKVALKSEKICLAVPSQTHITVYAHYTHIYARTGCNSLFNYM